MHLCGDLLFGWFFFLRGGGGGIESRYPISIKIKNRVNPKQYKNFNFRGRGPKSDAFFSTFHSLFLRETKISFYYYFSYVMLYNDYFMIFNDFCQVSTNKFPRKSIIYARANRTKVKLYCWFNNGVGIIFADSMGLLISIVYI